MAVKFQILIPFDRFIISVFVLVEIIITGFELKSKTFRIFFKVRVMLMVF